MAIPLSGSISVSTIADEFGGTVPHSLSEYYRGAGLVPNAPQTFLVPSSGAMPMSSFYGTADRIVIPLNITANTANYDVYTNLVASPAYPSYVAGFSSINVTVDSGVVVSSTSPSVYALSIPSAFNPGDVVTLTNNGTIAGNGGSGGNGSTGGPGAGGSGASGGNALYVSRPVTVTNNGTLAGGGGGGGGGASGRLPYPISQVGIAPGGGGGGGAGIPVGSGGGGASPGSPGQPGTTTSGGPGGGGGTFTNPYGSASGGPGGAGGARGAAGSGGTPAPSSGGAGGSGGSAGKYVVGSPFVVWNVTGNRYGGSA